MNRDDLVHNAKERWDKAAADFDREADHGLGNPAVKRAWSGLLKEWLPADTSRVLDAGCGTGSLSLLVAEMGHDVTGIDFSEAMIAKAAIKAEPVASRTRFVLMNAEAPSFAGDSFDVVLSRHVLWTFQDPASVLAGWSERLRSPARMILI